MNEGQYEDGLAVWQYLRNSGGRMNEGQYCLSEDGLAVTEGPRKLPQNWTSPTTWQGYQNLNNGTSWTDENLLTIGWYPYQLNDTPPAQYAEYYDRTLSDFDIQADHVEQTAIYTQWDIEQVKEYKNQELEAQVVQYSANEVAVNPKANDYINDDAKWLVDEQAKLARESDWNTVAGYDTTKPTVLSLPNDYVGRSYVAQGAALSTENEIARNNGLQEPWQQTEVDAFIAANKPAADDSSGTTEPVQPTYKLRQGVAKVSEQASRIVIYRFDVDDPNPALQRNYGMKLLNRQDSRDLYVFSYTGLTYLTWNKFEDLGNGTWGFEGQPAEQQYTDTDLGFIFSYGTNPAVEADYFTDRVDFEAGVDQINIIVAWDTQ